LFRSAVALLLSFGFGFGCFDFHYFAEGKVVGVDAGIIYFVKANDNWVFNTALVYRGNGAHFLIPVGFFAENPNFRTALSHELFFLGDE
jgi:hypothetical protein